MDEEVVANHYVEWRFAADFERRMRAARDAVLRGEPLALPAGQREMMATLKGLDLAFKRVNPLYMGRSVPDSLSAARAQYGRFGKFNQDGVSGALLPKFARPDRDTEEPDRLDLPFDHVVRVRPEQCQYVYRHVASASQRLSARHRAAGLTLGCAAFLDDESELSVSIVDRGGERHYRIEPDPNAGLEQRIDDLLDGFDRSGVELGIVPESACSEALLRHWQSALRNRSGAATSSLSWVLVGTGNLRSDDPPRNTAALLDARTGAVMFEQSKQYRFVISAEQQAATYKLKAFDASGPLREDIYVPRQLWIAELGSARMAIAICEDLGRLESLLPSLTQNGVSHILSPVFAQPIRPWRWEQQAGSALAGAGGAVVAVANSLVVGRVMGIATPMAASLVHTPWGDAVQVVNRPLDRMRFVVRDEKAPEALDELLS